MGNKLFADTNPKLKQTLHHHDVAAYDWNSKPVIELFIKFVYF